MTSERGYKYGVPQWEIFLLCPVSKDCTTQVAFTGEVTTSAIDRLIEYLEITKSEVPKPLHTPSAEIGEQR